MNDEQLKEKIETFEQVIAAIREIGLINIHDGFNGNAFDLVISTVATIVEHSTYKVTK